MPIVIPPICKKNSSLNSKCILCRTSFNRFTMYVAVGPLLGSFLMWSAAAINLPWFGILVYKEVTSSVAYTAPFEIGPNLVMFLMKS